MKPLHCEQKFDQLWIWFGLVTSTIITVILVGNALKDEENLFWRIFAISMVLMPFVVIGGFLVAKLQICLDQGGITYRFYPIHIKWRKVQIDDIEEVCLAKFDALGDFGGWGIRKNKTGTRVFIIKGEVGIKLDMKDGKSIILGMGNGLCA